MMKHSEMICIVCPNGCRLQVVYDDVRIREVTDALCPKGAEYAHSEVFAPRRTFTSTVRVRDGELPLVSVRSDGVIPKARMREAADHLRAVILEAPVAFHQVIDPDFLATGVRLIATRAVARKTT